MSATLEPIIYIVDDDAGVRGSLSCLLESVGFKVEVFGEPKAFIAALRVDRPACTVLDLRTPGMSGLEVLTSLRERTTAMPVIMISAHADVEVAVQAMRFGACDFVQKPYSSDLLLSKIQNAVAMHRQLFADEREKRRILRHIELLSVREREVLQLLGYGHSTKTIADRLTISAKTVDNHRTNILRKTKTHSAAELTRLAILGGLAVLAEGKEPT